MDVLIENLKNLEKILHKEKRVNHAYLIRQAISRLKEGD